MVRSSSVRPLSRAVLVEQAHGDGPRGDVRVAGQLPGRDRCRAPRRWERPGHCDLVNQRSAAAPQSGIAGLPHDPTQPMTSALCVAIGLASSGSA